MEAESERVTLQDFNMLSLVGYGNYAKIILVRRKVNQKVYAIKIIKKKKEGETNGIKKQHAYIERQILTECQHPFIVKLYSTFQKQRRLYYVLEYCPGGELFGLIRRLKRMSEEMAKFYAAQILIAIQFLHSKHYMYRDLKPENVLIDKNGFIKLIDFGLSCKAEQIEKYDLIAGTPQYLPPEVFKKGNHVGLSVDWWAFGSLIFQMVAGFPPFFVQHQKFEVIKKKICNQQPPLYFITNPLLKDLLQKLLDKDPKTRLGSGGAQEIKSHRWFFGTSWQALLKQEVKAPFVPEVKGDTDIHWFEGEEHELTPPEDSSVSEKSLAQKYQQFSLSWKSSNQQQHYESEDNSPPQMVINIKQMS